MPHTTAASRATRNELDLLRSYLREQGAFVQPSASETCAPCLFVKKQDGSLRLCVNYRGLNAITVKQKAPLPPVNEMLLQLHGAKIFTKLDLRGAEDLRVSAGDEWKTAFATHLGRFESKVMPYGLCIAPTIYQSMMNRIMKELINVSVVVYLDHLLIYSRDVNEHENHVEAVLRILDDNALHVNSQGTTFSEASVEFLGFKVSGEGLSIDKPKIPVITRWPVPLTRQDVQVFFDFVNFYRRFIKDYSVIVKPLNKLLADETAKFKWTAEEDTAMKQLKLAFMKAPSMLFFDQTKQIFVEVEASDSAMSTALLQYGEDKLLHPIAFRNKNFTAAEYGYDVHDKELLAIIRALEEWRPYLEEAGGIITIWSDYRNMEVFTTKEKPITRRHERWHEKLSQYSFRIHSREGKLLAKDDILPRVRALRLGERDCNSIIQTFLDRDQQA